MRSRLAIRFCSRYFSWRPLSRVPAPGDESMTPSYHYYDTLGNMRKAVLGMIKSWLIIDDEVSLRYGVEYTRTSSLRLVLWTRRNLHSSTTAACCVQSSSEYPFRRVHAQSRRGHVFPQFKLISCEITWMQPACPYRTFPLIRRTPQV